MSTKQPDPALEAAIRQLEATALSFAYQATNIASVRSEYIRRTRELSVSLRAAYDHGELSAKAAAETAHQMRNVILEQQRKRSAAVGRAMAKQLKAQGLPLDDILEKLSKRVHGKAFGQLDNAQQTAVYLELVESAGRARPSATKFAARAGAAGRGVFLLGLGLAAYNIANAKDKVWQTGREAAGMGGGIAGSVAAGAVAGIWLGPLGVAIGALVGGVAGALMSDQVYVAVAGPSDRKAGHFLKRFTNVYSTDEAAIANALYSEMGIDLDRVHDVFMAMNESFTTDADDVAVLYLRKVFAGRGLVQEALRLNRACRDTLIRILDDGWTTAEERGLIGQLRALR
ncbi:hypothetical protein WBO78_07765 [Bosea sp. CCNWLW174]|uniref:hypothetical protein n=1 Tax=unclassified Bosea (in: a-proteobacteria) TaxID=2653178 RepID=UPI0030157E92